MKRVGHVYLESFPGVNGFVAIAQPFSSCGNTSNPIHDQIVLVEKPGMKSGCSFAELVFAVVAASPE